MSDIELNTKGLDAILKALEKAPIARVGILGGGKTRDAAGPTGNGAVAPTGAKSLSNATLGAMHEFGTSTHPVRSFLRMPLTMLLDKELEKAGLFSPAAIRKLVATSSALEIVQKLAVLAEGIVQGAFDTGGYGIWIPSNFARKKVHQTLVETQQLRNSITSEVKDNG